MLKINTIPIKIVVLVVVLFCTIKHNAQSQDIIFKIDKSKIEAKVAEISETEIKYRKFQNLDGPVYTVSISLVSHIKYENGSVEFFTAKKTTAVVPKKEPVAVPAKPQREEVRKSIPRYSNPKPAQEQAAYRPAVAYSKPSILPKIIVGGSGHRWCGLCISGQSWLRQKTKRPQRTRWAL